MRHAVSMFFATMLVVGAMGCSSLSPGIHRLSLADDPIGGASPWLLYVDASGAPTHVRDVIYDRTHELRFPPGAVLSSDVCGDEACDRRVERATGCLVATYDDYGAPPRPRDDVGRLLDGRYRACPDSMVEPALSVVGAIEPATALSEGSLLLRANFPLDAAIDVVELTVDGSPIPSGWTPGDDLTVGVIQMPRLPPGAVLGATYVGTRTTAFGLAATAFSTGAEVADRTFAAPPPTAAIDWRGHELVHEAAGAMSLSDEISRRLPYAVAIALGDPPAGATALTVIADEARRFDSFNETFLLRADGSRGPSAYTVATDITLPTGTGGAWLVVVSDNFVQHPFWPDSELLFRIHELSWSGP